MRRRPPANDLRAFLRRLPVAAAIAVVAWLGLRLAWNPALAATTEIVARFYEWPRAAQIVVDGDHAIVGRTDLRAGSARLRLSLTQIHFNLVPFLALVLALPLWWRGGGLGRLALGLALFFAAHVLTLLWQLKVFYAFSLGAWSAANYGPFLRNLYAGLRYFFDIPVTFTLPLVLWVALFPQRVFAVVGLGDDGGDVSQPKATVRGGARTP